MVRVSYSSRLSTLSAACTCGLAVLGAAVWGQTVAQTDGTTRENNQKVEKELKELNEQRAKIDSRIRELRRQSRQQGPETFSFSDGSGRSRVFTTPRAGTYYFSDGTIKEMKELTPEQRKKVEEAMAEARRALEKVKGDLPPGFVMPDIDSMVNNALRFRTLQPGGVVVAPKAFDTKEFREQMEKMRDTIRNNSELNRSLVVPRIYTVPRSPVLPNSSPAPLLRGSDPGLREEIRELRRELEQLREELHKERGGKPAPTNRNFNVVEPVSL